MIYKNAIFTKEGFDETIAARSASQHALPSSVFMVTKPQQDAYLLSYHSAQQKSTDLSVLASGGRWIRTTESTANRFTVCPLWPLGNSPNYFLFAKSRWPDSNRQPADYKSAALPLSHIGPPNCLRTGRMGPTGLEPVTPCL